MLIPIRQVGDVASELKGVVPIYVVFNIIELCSSTADVCKVEGKRTPKRSLGVL